jgi:aromatic ring-opening dioxygenase catalytic subunit (LigB family)
MGEILAGMATSHAFTLVDPADWDRQRELNRQGYFRRYQAYPPVHPRIAEEEDGAVRERYQHVADALRRLGGVVEALHPTALVVVGDDQNENFVEDCLPQFAIFVLDQAELQLQQGSVEDTQAVAPYARALAQTILDHAVECDFDLAVSHHLRHPRGLGHAFGPPLRFLNPGLRVPIVCISVNATHWPAPSPRRCLEFGRLLRAAIAGSDERVVLYGSGGLSHFTGGYPYAALGRHCYGEIDTAFDARLLQALGAGDVDYLASLSSRDLLEHGDVEFRSWLVVQGALDGCPADTLAYEPFHRGIMGMGCALWRTPAALAVAG